MTTIEIEQRMRERREWIEREYARSPLYQSVALTIWEKIAEDLKLYDLVRQ